MRDENKSHADAAATLSHPDAAAPTAPAAPPGYELLEVVGRGGMGVVYRARDIALDREVAVKLLLDRYAPDSPTAARFLDEARITGQLQHPGIPAVYQVGTLPGGRPFLAMKLIKGDTLDALLKANAPLDALAVFGSISQAVGYAHAHGVIHRDLKPANVMVGAFGEVQVMDWGLAKVLAIRERPRPESDPEATQGAATEIRTQRDSDTPFTQHGSVLGTPAYMPPEQAAGELDKVDARSDVFGLGGLLCVLLTGQPPFVGRDAESVRLNAMRGKTEDAFARLDACSADPGVVALCKRCLAFEPADRPATADAVAQEVAGLRHAADERAKQAERDKHATEVRAAERRKRVRVAGGLAALVFAAVLAGGSAALVQWRRADTALTQVREQEHATADALAALQVEEAKARAAFVQVTSEQARTQAALTQVSNEQARTTEALAVADRAADVTRDGLVGWLLNVSRTYQPRSSGNEQLREYEYRKTESIVKLHKMLGHSLGTARPSPAQMSLNAEYYKMLGDIISKDNYCLLDASHEYEIAIRITRQLLEANPQSIPLRRQLANCLLSLGNTHKYEYGKLRSPPIDRMAAGAIFGSVWQSQIYDDAVQFDKALRLQVISESIGVMLSFEDDFSPEDRTGLAERYEQITRYYIPYGQYKKINDKNDIIRVRSAFDSALVIYNDLWCMSDCIKDVERDGYYNSDELKDKIIENLTRRGRFELVCCNDLVSACAFLNMAIAESIAPRNYERMQRSRGFEYLLVLKCKVFSAKGNYKELALASIQLAATRVKNIGNYYEYLDEDSLDYLMECISLAKSDPLLTGVQREAILVEYSSRSLEIILTASKDSSLGGKLRRKNYTPLQTNKVFKELLKKHPLTLDLLGYDYIYQLDFDPAGLMLEVEVLAESKNLDPENIFNIARMFSSAAVKIPDKREEYALRAVVLLSRVANTNVDKSYYRIILGKDDIFVSLRGRVDFQKLLESLPLELAPPPREAK